jgi:zinc finger SWIM domain-containing protein 3
MYLKVLDLMNIKLLPPHYILKRWTREARSGTIQDCRGKNIIENPNLAAILRYKVLSHKFVNLATEAANSEECCILIENTLDIFSKQVKGRMNACQSNHDAECDEQMILEAPKVHLRAARLKKNQFRIKA